jgi:hypothetical protein
MLLSAIADRYAASGEIETPRVFSVNVFPFTHACDAVNAALYRKFPAVDASHTEMWVNVSDVPPFVHTGAVPDMAIAPELAADCVTATRVADPTAAAVAPDAPGSAVCSFTNKVATAVNVVPAPRITFSHGLARLVVETPTVMTLPLHWLRFPERPSRTPRTQSGIRSALLAQSSAQT